MFFINCRLPFVRWPPLATGLRLIFLINWLSPCWRLTLVTR